VLQVLDLLMGTGELAGAVQARPARPGDGLAHHGRFERAGAGLGESIRLRPPRLALQHAQHLRNHIAGALDRHGIADTHTEPLDLVLIVERRVRHHHAADGHRLEPRNRR
jgi:hypothetical protein